ncbi:MAG: alanine racemase [Paraglaciecola sp.]|uniref:alanine racemase n=1 Tax=Paraglaciecola sp. TaxID=1920173 RepID=UPI00329A3186
MSAKQLKIKDLQTPCLLLDINTLKNNINSLSMRIQSLGSKLRPHVKTHKSANVMQEVLDGGNVQGITVSTLKEADYFFEQGERDILYAVSISPDKLSHIQQLMSVGCDIKIVLDCIEAAQAVNAFGEEQGITFKVLIELDTDGHRSGVLPESEELIDIAKALNDGKGSQMLGVMTHAGESYTCNNPDALLAIARQERDRTLLAANRLNQANLPCPIVSVGSTPTAFSIDDLTGITEVRAGVYTFFDLVMKGVGVCTQQDIALSVLSSVIGFQKAKGWIITDGGWMALSRDRGTSNQDIDYGYGLVSDINGHAVEDFIVSSANQEHGIVACQTKGKQALPFNITLGSQIRVLPNHACSTASQYTKYYVVDGENVVAEWERINGW